FGAPFFVHAVVPLSLGPTPAPNDLTIPLRRGATVRGRIVLPNAATSGDGMVVSPTFLPRGPVMTGDPILLTGNRFEIPGCPPNETVPLWFFDLPAKVGAFVKLPTDPTRDHEVPVTALAGARARFVDAAGVPLDLSLPNSQRLELEIRPGVDSLQPSPQREGPAAIHLDTAKMYPHAFDPKGTRDGVWRSDHLIPGARYRLVVPSRSNTPVVTTFTAPATGVLDLGTLTVKQKLAK
ncbi:MAG TPA: hypothetical protein VM597_01995, partial [Gemmataceae bacterium]|nr:hypothetical protein [Gemmataceae bacterium]